MTKSRALFSLAAILLSATAALAQTTPAPSATTPMPATSSPATPPLATPVPAARMVNLNTATAAELDALPDIGKARTRVIMSARRKAPFKDWADFDKRTAGTSVNAGVKAKIKPMATF